MGKEALGKELKSISWNLTASSSLLPPTPHGRTWRSLKFSFSMKLPLIFVSFIWSFKGPSCSFGWPWTHNPRLLCRAPGLQVWTTTANSPWLCFPDECYLELQDFVQGLSFTTLWATWGTGLIHCPAFLEPNTWCCTEGISNVCICVYYFKI